MGQKTEEQGRVRRGNPPRLPFFLSCASRVMLWKFHGRYRSAFHVKQLVQEARLLAHFFTQVAEELAEAEDELEWLISLNREGFSQVGERSHRQGDHQQQGDLFPAEAPTEEQETPCVDDDEHSG